MKPTGRQVPKEAPSLALPFLNLKEDIADKNRLVTQTRVEGMRMGE
jgi:hypothetical protein